ncbi:MAG: DUF167 domain-containing protein [Candidatus Moraniibacteriota bacterium]|jgi:uncharacterized protein
MKISVRVVTRAHKNIVQKCSDNSYRIRTTIIPVDGKANKAILKLLADYFKVPKSNIKILKGQKSKNKIIEIM